MLLGSNWVPRKSVSNSNELSRSLIFFWWKVLIRNVSLRVVIKPVIHQTLSSYWKAINIKPTVRLFSVISKGQTETNRYRFLARNGGYVWIVTQATVVFDKQKPQSVVCVNYVIRWVRQSLSLFEFQTRLNCVNLSPRCYENQFKLLS